MAPARAAPEPPASCPASPDDPRREARNGTAAAVGAFLLWGILPLYWKRLDAVALSEVLAHRVFWSMVAAGLLLVLGRGPGAVRTLFARPRLLKPLAASGVLIGMNWSIYVYAVNADRIVETSLGYYLTPLVSMLLGVWALKERLRARQWAAVAMAASGSLLLALQFGRTPWVALSLALTFGVYGLIKKRTGLDSLSGLFAETLVWTPLALLYFALADPEGRAGHAAEVRLLLVGSGAVTVAPLLLFAAGARRLKLTTIGFLQYLGPSCQLALAVFLYREPFAWPHLAAFSAIWAGLALYSTAGLRLYRNRAR